ncbi:MAG: TRAM domain-containing protein, partial [Candidatus Rokuibacteriota bacterium]
ARSHRLLGRTVDVLVDGRSRKNAAELQGRTRCNRVVNLEAQEAASVGDVLSARITEVLPHSLRGTVALLPEETVCLSR